MEENFYQENDEQHFSDTQAPVSQPGGNQQSSLPAWMFRESPVYASGHPTASQALRRLRDMPGTPDTSSELGADIPLFQAMVMVLTHPSVETFEDVKGHASGSLVGGLLLVSILLSSIASHFIANVGAGLLIINALIAFPLYFLTVGIQFGVARSLSDEKQGVFWEQCYTGLLFGLPLSLIESLTAGIPIVGKLISFVLGLYTLVLLVLAMKAIHAIGTFKALLALMAPLGLAVVIALCYIVATGAMSSH